MVNTKDDCDTPDFKVEYKKGNDNECCEVLPAQSTSRHTFGKADTTEDVESAILRSTSAGKTFDEFDKTEDVESAILRRRSYSVENLAQLTSRHTLLTVPQYLSIDTITTSNQHSTRASNRSLIWPFHVSERRKKLNTELLEAVKHLEVQEIERLIKEGASPNATCHVQCVTACHLAALRSDDALSVLIRHGADKTRRDRIGSTPLHVAAWAGNVKQIAILLEFSIDLQNRLMAESWTEDMDYVIKSVSHKIKNFVNVKCELPRALKLSMDWNDGFIYHDCKDFEKDLPTFQSGWTSLHAASVRAEPRCVRILLAAGANVDARDLIGRTPLDVVGLSCYTCQTSIDPDKFAEIVSIFLNLNCYNFTTKNKKTIGSPLHIAVLVESLNAVRILAEAKMPIDWLDRDGLTPLHLCVKKKLKEHLQILVNFRKSCSKMENLIDVRDKDSHTILHKSILEGWKPGVSIALQAGASITATDLAGETALHLAATTGDIEILNEILNVVRNQKVIDTVNHLKETPLFKAVGNGHAECVRRILEEGASIEVSLPWGINVFHAAAMKGHIEVLQIVLNHDYGLTRSMINFLTVNDRHGFGPIHFAVRQNHTKCVKLLLSKNAYCNLKTSHGDLKGSTPMHLAATNNNVQIAKLLLKHDINTLSTTDDFGWTPLHKASYNGSREMIMFLLENGADLSALTYGMDEISASAIEMIMNNLSKPTEFMEYVFDGYISTNCLNLQDPNCRLTINYTILVPCSGKIEEMKVIKALVRTGNRYGQRRLLVHPLIESFLYLKWKNLWPFFYTMLIFYGFFVMSLTTYIIAEFFYVDTNTPVPSVLNSTAWTVILYLTILLIISQEVLYIEVNHRYFLKLETWVKLSSIGLALALPNIVSNNAHTDEDWPRHVATIALLLSWLEMMFLLSRFPKWGYYVLMFGKVSSNVIRILITFVFLLIGFSLSFMIQFHSKKPFEGPWAALIKTMVMMTSEFDYKDLLEDNSNPTTTIIVVRIIFIVFVILAAIVLMNLIVGVAVHDLHKLQLLGNIMRLAKQVEFLASLEALVHNNRIFNKFFPKKIKNVLKNKTISKITLRPSEPKTKMNKTLPKVLREAIFEKAQARRKQIEEEIGSQSFKAKLEEIYKATVTNSQNGTDKVTNSEKNDTKKKRLEDIGKQIEELNSNLNHIKDKTKTNIREMQHSIYELNTKIDAILKYLLSNAIERSA